MHSDPSSTEYLPASQFTQLTADVLLYVPRSQSVHRAAPSLNLNLPGTQLTHLSLVPVQPALHRQASIAVLPIAENEFAGHQTHSDLSSAEYLPASQFTQVTAEVLEYLPSAQPEQASDP